MRSNTGVCFFRFNQTCCNEVGPWDIQCLFMKEIVFYFLAHSRPSAGPAPFLFNNNIGAHCDELGLWAAAQQYTAM